MHEQDLQTQIMSFIRGFGLLQRDETPCGRPIPTSQAHALQALREEAGLTQQALSDRLHLDKSTTSRLVQQMVELGWLAKETNPANRRELRLFLTPTGQGVAEEVSQAAQERHRLVWESLPPAKRAQVLESLTLLNQAIRAK